MPRHQPNQQYPHQQRQMFAPPQFSPQPQQQQQARAQAQPAANTVSVDHVMTYIMTAFLEIFFCAFPSM
jgi:hypothetical protein